MRRAPVVRNPVDNMANYPHSSALFYFAGKTGIYPVPDHLLLSTPGPYGDSARNRTKDENSPQRRFRPENIFIPLIQLGETRRGKGLQGEDSWTKQPLYEVLRMLTTSFLTFQLHYHSIVV